MFGTALLEVYHSPSAIDGLDKTFAELFLDWKAISKPILVPSRFERRSIASSEIDPKIMSWLGITTPVSC